MKMLRTGLYAAVILASLAVILDPQLRGPGGALLMTLYFTMGADMIFHSWRAGHLHKPFAELAKDPPRIGATQGAAYVLGAIAMALVI